MVRTVAGVMPHRPGARRRGGRDVEQPFGAPRWSPPRGRLPVALESHDAACDGPRAPCRVRAERGGASSATLVLPVAPPVGSKCSTPGHGEPGADPPDRVGILARPRSDRRGGAAAHLGGSGARATAAALARNSRSRQALPGRRTANSSRSRRRSGSSVHGARSLLLRAGARRRHLELRDCVVSDDGGRVACVPWRARVRRGVGPRVALPVARRGRAQDVGRIARALEDIARARHVAANDEARRGQSRVVNGLARCA